MVPFNVTPDKYHCFYCPEKFFDAPSMIMHNKNMHKCVKQIAVPKGRYIKLEVSELACKLCPKPMKTYQSFLDHAIEEHRLDIHRQFANTLMPLKLADGTINCLECGESFNYVKALLRHYYMYHSKSTIFPCHICGALFARRSRVEEHYKMVHHKGPTPCECGEVLPSVAAYRKHRSEKHSKKGLRCPKCQELQRSRHMLKIHLSKVHDDKTLQFECEYCSKVFVSKWRMMNHKHRVHLKERRFLCEHCNFTSFSKMDLSKHKANHSDERPFQCTHCEKAFKRKKTLKNHLDLHSSVPAYACDECDKSFMQAATLYCHKKVHRK